MRAKYELDFEANTDLQTGLMHTIGWFLNDIKTV